MEPEAETPPTPPSPRIRRTYGPTNDLRVTFNDDESITIPEALIKRLTGRIRQADSTQILQLTRAKDEVRAAFGDNRLMRCLTERIHQIANEGHPQDHIFFHPRPIGYAGKKAKTYWIKREQKDNWETYPTLLDCITNFTRAPTGSKRKDCGRQIFTKVALFTTPMANRIKHPTEHKTKAWHCWAAALVSNETGAGKHLLVLDSDSQMTPEELKTATLREAFWHCQLEAYRVFNIECSLESVWMGNMRDNGHGDAVRARRSVGDFVDGRCVPNTVYWALRIASQPDRPFDENDARWQGFHLLERISNGYTRSLRKYEREA